MATYVKRNGKIRVQIRSNGRSKSATFQTKREAQVWAVMHEHGVSVAGQVTDHLSPTDGKYCPANFAEILTKYRDKVTPTQKYADKERNFIKNLLKAPFVTIPMSELRTEHFVDWRDYRLTHVKPATVARDFDLLRRAAKVANQQWDWVSPVDQLSRCPTPTPPPTAHRRISEERLDLLRTEANRSRVNYLRPAIELALLTGMRRSELTSLLWDDVDFERRRLTVRNTKNGHDRTIPIYDQLAQVLRRLDQSKTKVLGGCSASALTDAWKRCRRRAGVTNVRFHDLRHEAVSRLFEYGFSPIEVASISGHRSLSQLMRYSHAMQDKMLARMNEVLS